ncbi:hypothetical protein AaE_003639 [Aphanomyces astaci]|uniref:Deacetylase sirtuin-type domain-containing protein n=1 Tax=Aphanomyces astaci TaxID=112090 RepID=A0A6A5AUT8_APHAT|nr:hypothetical protein AaE_003639 [Aphanomyces astaci]
MAAASSSLIRDAAEKVKGADYLLIMTGAGFSADSGLPVYMDIANVDAYSKMGVEYHDLCDPCWVCTLLIRDDLPVFYGFWGDCFNMYRDTTPHAGYEILQRWKARVMAKSGVASHDDNSSASTTTPDPFFSFTSNVDAHFLKFFQPNEVYEIHGNTEHWQCANRSCSKAIWTLPSAFRFDVDTDTMLASHTDAAEGLACPECGGPARPNVLMFGDDDWIPNTTDKVLVFASYDIYFELKLVTVKFTFLWEWIARVQDVRCMLFASDEMISKRLVILEIGCGTRVPSVRIQSEQVLLYMLRTTRSHTRLADTGDYQAHLIRVNPDMEDDEFEWQGSDGHQLPPMTKIEGFGLATLLAIDQEIVGSDA